MNRSANRIPALIAGTGVTGRGTLPGTSGSSRYSRWSAQLANTTGCPDPAGRPAHGWPPYSITRLRTYHGAASISSASSPAPPAPRVVPSWPAPSSAPVPLPAGAAAVGDRRRMRVIRPPSFGLGSVHQRSPETHPGQAGRPSSLATSAAVTGDAHVP